MCELSESYELWVKVMQDAGLSYGPADTLIAHLEAQNETLKADNRLLMHVVHGRAMASSLPKHLKEE